jgi:hypothetical protein
VRNRIRCHGCNEVLESKFRHDFQACECGVFVDGGRDYQRLGTPEKPGPGPDGAWFSILRDDDSEVVWSRIERGL